MGMTGQHHAPAALTPEKKSWMDGWMGPRAGLDGCGKSRPHWDSIPGTSMKQTSLNLILVEQRCELAEREISQHRNQAGQ
jgi:hypothetical protein